MFSDFEMVVCKKKNANKLKKPSSRKEDRIVVNNITLIGKNYYAVQEYSRVSGSSIAPFWAELQVM